ncbi:MAG: prepilin-type N-terminal cleavage/methylation domain-containing protein [Bacilli bacterium]
MKKGFTLVELLATIAILAVIMLISVGSFTAISAGIKKNLLETKIKSIEDSAVLYGQEHQEELTDKDCTIDGVSYSFCKKITVAVLLEKGFLKTEEKDGIMLNNVTQVNMADDLCTIYKKNNRIYAIMTDIKSNRGK